MISKKCRICGREFDGCLTYRHLVVHKISWQEYKDKYEPGLTTSNGSGSYKVRKQVSATLKRKYASGEIKHPTDAIQKTLKKKYASGEHRKDYEERVCVACCVCGKNVKIKKSVAKAKGKKYACSLSCARKRDKVWDRLHNEKIRNRVKETKAKSRQAGHHNTNYIPRIQFPCTNCGKLKEIREDTKDKRHFCSFKCQGEWKHNSEEIKATLRKTRTLQVFPSKDTSIEVAIQQVLTQLGIYFVKHKTLMSLGIVCSSKVKYHQADIALPENKLIIECDGDYWHNYPNGTEEDRTIDEAIQNAGWKILRLWENEINGDLGLCVKKIAEYSISNN